MLEVAKICPSWALKYASDELKEKESFLIAAIANNEKWVQSLPNKFKNETFYLKLGERKIPYFVQYIETKFKSNKEFLLKLLKNYENPSHVFWEMDKNLQNDQKFMLKAMTLHKKFFPTKTISQNNSYKPKHYEELCEWRIKFGNQWAMAQYASEELRKNAAFMKEAIFIALANVEHADITLLNDPSFMIDIVKINGCALQIGLLNVKSDKNVVLAAIEQDPHSVQFAEDSLKRDCDIQKLSTQKDSTTKKYF